MPPLKFLCGSILVPLLCGGLLLILSYGLPGGKPPAVPRRGEAGFATLTLDASYPDRHIRERLAREGIATTIGESSQWVFLDDFGTLEQVPLDRYWERVEPFDPRNDGYAELLRSLFVLKGERRLFIGLQGAPLDLEARVQAALGDLRYSLSAAAPRRFPRTEALLFILAAALTLALVRDLPASLCFLPLWAPLAGFGAAGFALAAVLAGLCRALREPARDYFISRRYGTARERAPLGRGVRVLSGLFLAAAAALGVFGDFPLLTVPGALILAPAVLCFSLWAESFRGLNQGHIRFKPVPIASPARRPAPSWPVMVPFTLAALVLQLLPALFPASGVSPADPAPGRAGWKTPPELNAERYRKHAAFQQAFSYAPLGAGEASYLRYSLAEDGLIDDRGSGKPAFADPEAVPPFPLASLIDFFDAYDYTDAAPVSSRGRLCPFIVLGLWVPLIIRDRRRRSVWGKLSLLKDKQIAA